MEGEESSHIDVVIYVPNGRPIQAGGCMAAMTDVIDSHPEAYMITACLDGGVGGAGHGDPRSEWLHKAVARATSNRKSALHPRVELGVPQWQPIG